MIYNYNKKNVEKAQNLRKNMTPEEKKLWYQFLKRLPLTVLNTVWMIIINLIDKEILSCNPSALPFSDIKTPK